jgi:hypothetical protein
VTNGKPEKFTSTWKTKPSPQFKCSKILQKKNCAAILLDEFDAKS